MKRSVFASLSAAVILSALAARADVITPQESACNGHAAGDACILPAGGAGRCVSRTVTVGNPAYDASRVALFCESPGDAGPAADAGASTTNSSGCSVRGVGVGASGWASALLVGALAATLRRRRRSPGR
ncbi:MAG: MYXO-CTERM sorting domain-containing protein [Polyangiales bacterium]